MPVDHYENFPVASILLPKHLRPAVEAIYAFARSADDIADEGDASAEQRLAQLQHYISQLQLLQAGQPSKEALFQRLGQVVADYQLPWQPFYDLLSAFSQDVGTTRYADYASLMDYCRRSANPVGHLMLHLYGAANEQNLHDSDAICSALQIINFWQDVEVDWRKQRIYLPLEDMQRFGVDEAVLQKQDCNLAFQQLMRFQLARADMLMMQGASLALRLPGRFGWELRLVVQGGLRILRKIEAANYDVFRQRPVLKSVDWIVILWRACCMRK